MSEGSATNGTYKATLNLVDTVGNETTNVTTLDPPGVGATPLPTFDLDATTPVVSNLEFSLGATPTTLFSEVSGHNTVTITFAVNQAVSASAVKLLMSGAHPHLPMSLGAGACTTASTGTPRFFTCTYTVSQTAHPTVATQVTAADTHGFHDLRVEVTDASGNVGRTSKGLEFDFVNPHLVSATVSPENARAGGQIFYSISANEPLTSASLAATRDGTGAALSPGFLPISGSSFTFSRNIQPTDTTGKYNAGFTLEDRAGNVTTVAQYKPEPTVTKPVPTFFIDVDVPRLTLATLATDPDLELLRNTAVQPNLAINPNPVVRVSKVVKNGTDPFHYNRFFVVFRTSDVGDANPDLRLSVGQTQLSPPEVVTDPGVCAKVTTDFNGQPLTAGDSRHVCTIDVATDPRVRGWRARSRRPRSPSSCATTPATWPS